VNKEAGSPRTAHYGFVDRVLCHHRCQYVTAKDKMTLPCLNAWYGLGELVLHHRCSLSDGNRIRVPSCMKNPWLPSVSSVLPTLLVSVLSVRTGKWVQELPTSSFPAESLVQPGGLMALGTTGARSGSLHLLGCMGSIWLVCFQR
jgi:hypothetical protein